MEAALSLPCALHALLKTSTVSHKKSHNSFSLHFLKSTLLLLTLLRYGPQRCSIPFTDTLSALLTSTIRAIFPAQQLSYYKPSRARVMRILIWFLQFCHIPSLKFNTALPTIPLLKQRHIIRFVTFKFWYHFFADRYQIVPGESFIYL